MRLNDILTILRKPAKFAPVAILAAFAIFTGGCETSGLLDQTETMRTTKHRLLVPVLPSIAEGLDEAEPEFANADDVRQADLKVDTSDYVIGANDLVSISINEVAGPGLETVKTVRITESGMVSLPLIQQVKAAGLTEAELEKAIAQAYRDKNIIQNAQVAVTVLEARQRVFSVLGVVGRPGQYQIVQSDFRIIDALTLAGDVQVQGIEHMYIIRKDKSAGATTKPADTKPTDIKPGDKKPDPLEGKQGQLSLLESAKVNVPKPINLAILDQDPVKDESEGGKKVLIDGKWVPVKAEQPKTNDPLENPKTDVPKTDATKTDVPIVDAPKTDTPKKDFEFEGPKMEEGIRIIRVPLERLQHGELQYNIVVRPNDTIIVPSPKVGEYYIGGHVQRAGVYSLTGRQITLKQAMISAGMFDALAWPERTEIIRRIGKDKELFVRLDFPKVMRGEMPDFYLRPYDTINVGTNALAPFLASLRGAFRFTYGFGFIYDRNFYDDPNNNNNNNNN